MTNTPPPGIVRVSVPLKWKTRGGRKLVVAPDDISIPSLRHQRDESMVKAIARGFRWRSLMDTGKFTTIDDLASAEKISASYMSRVTRLSLLAPSIVDAILDGRHPPFLQLRTLLKPFPLDWSEQLAHFGFEERSR